MTSDNRKYNYTGELTLKRSRVLKVENQPKDDILPWLFLVVGERRFTFFYKIEEPLKATYESSFNAQMSFLMEEVKDFIEINHTYEVWRAEEPVGTVKIINIIE
jgi:hypothetical protein